MFVAQNIMADVTVQIDGIDNTTVKAKMERTMSAFLTEVNNAQSSKRALNFDASKWVIGAAPLTPFLIFSQVSATVLPTGVRAPKPVTTTLFNSIADNSCL